MRQSDRSPFLDGEMMAEDVFDNAMLWIGDGTAFSGHLIVNDRLIASVEKGAYRGSLPVTDIGGVTLSPGLIDLMTCGGFGQSVLHDEPLGIARQYLGLGVTCFQWAIGSLSRPQLEQLADRAHIAMNYPGSDAARMCGVYFEGPFYNPLNSGANPPEDIWPATPENVRELLDSFGDVINLINVSPGVTGDTEAIRALCRGGKSVTMSHSAAPADRVLACIEAGTSQLGHAWNNNSGPTKEPGVQQPTLEHVALLDERIRFVHLICDGTHLDPIMIRLMLKCRGLESICVVTDAMNLAGATEGPFTFDEGMKGRKINGVGRLDDGSLAGSGLLLPDHFRSFLKFTGAQPHEAIRTVTLNPAAAMGLDHEIGILAPGHAADFIAWDDKMTIKRVWHNGQELDEVSDYAEVQL